MEKTVAQIIEEVKEQICDKYCKYLNEKGHEDNPDWLFENGSPCDSCPLNRL